MYKAGEVISAKAYGLIDHWGIYTGENTVISKSKRGLGVIEQSISEFADGMTIKRIGYLGRRYPHEVIRFARSKIGQKWDLFDNCEHFSFEAHGEKPRSPQVRTGILGLILAAAIIYFGKK